MKKREYILAVLLIAGLCGLTNVFVVQAAPNISGDEQATTNTDPEELPGPVSGAVDPNYATPAAAMQTLMDESMDMDGMTTMSNNPRTSGTQQTATQPAAGASLDPQKYGQWTKLPYDMQSRSVHVSLLRTGKVLLVAGSGNIMNTALKAHLWDPATGIMKSVPPPYDMFCGGHVALPNGDIMIVGGTTLYSGQNNGKWMGSPKAYKFDVTNEKWVALPSMRDGRWYPTAVLNGAGNVDVFGGLRKDGGNNVIPETYNVATNTWSTMPQRTMPTYPGLVLEADGRYYYTGAKYGAQQVAPGIFGLHGAKQLVSGVTLQDQRRHSTSLLVGDANNQLAWLAGGGFPVIASTRLTDLKAASPVAVAGPSLPTAKTYVSAVDLPNLQTFETGGGTGTDTPVYEASTLNPVSRTIAPMAPPTVGRTYHSSAILMPDGTVATFGGDPHGAYFEMSVEIYKPPYMFAGTRPVITAGPTEISYGNTYAYSATATGATMTTAVLARPMSTTHSTDANQRTVKLQAVVTADGMSVTIPANHNIAPPGWYMLFLNDSLGRPSDARWVHIQ
jgi:hypothetical protein